MELIVDDLTKDFGHVTAINHISLSMTNGVYGLLGVNGAGKSSLTGALKEILASSGDVLSGVPPDLSPLTSPYDRLPFRFSDQVTFGWDAMPVPPGGMPPGQVDYFILSSLGPVFDRYYDMRLQRVALLIERMTRYESDLCQELVRGYFKATPPVVTGEVFQNLDAGKAGLVRREAGELAEACAQLRDGYLADTGS